MTLLAIDSGRRSGWALGQDRITEVGLVDFSLKSESHWKMHHRICKVPGAATVLVELPRWYPHERRIDVNDLLDLAVLVGRFADNFEARGAAVELVWPRSWKGNVPKEIMSQRIYEALSVEERALLPRKRGRKESRSALDHDHNVLDACGMWLWKRGRL